MLNKNRHYFNPFLLISLFFSLTTNAEVKRPEYYLEIKNHLFYPAQISIPANKKIKLVIHNLDNSPEEFDSFDLNREKVIFSKQRSIIFIGPLPEGEYTFFGEYHPNSARGKVIVTKQHDKKAVESILIKKQRSLNVN